MSNLSSFKSSVVGGWSRSVWDGLIDAMNARLAPLEENLGLERETRDAIIARGLTVIELELAPVVTQAEDKLTVIEQMRVDALAAYAIIQALADEDIGAVIQPLLVESQQMLDDANQALADANATIANIQTTDEKDQANGYAGLDAAGKLPFGKLSDVPAASEGAAGVAKLATGAEVQLGADANKAITPAALVSRTATTDRVGMAEIATEAEAKTGTDTDRIIAPFTLDKVIAARTVRFDAAQGLSEPQRTQARDNLGGTTVGNALFTATNKAIARAAIHAAPFDALAYSGMQVNGSMDVSRENGTAARTTGGYVIDGWRVDSFGVQTFSTAQVADAPAGLSNSIKITIIGANASPAAGDYLFFSQKIEGYRTARIAFGTASAQPISIGFWTKIHRIGTYSGSVRNSTDNRSYPFSFTQNVADTWEFKTVTIPGDVTGTWLGASNGVGLSVAFSMAVGPTFIGPADTWSTASYIGVPGTTNGMAATTDTFQITGVIVLPGIELPSSDRSALIMRPYYQEFPTCQRYLAVLDSTMNSFAQFGMGSILSTTSAIYVVYLPERLRALPTFSASAPADFGGTAITADVIDVVTCRINMTGTFVRAGDAANLQANNTLSAKLMFNARL